MRVCGLALLSLEMKIRLMAIYRDCTRSDGASNIVIAQ